MTEKVYFNALGIPRPKQSFKITQDKQGRPVYFTPTLTREWQEIVSKSAAVVMVGRDLLEGPISVTIDFYLPDKRTRDLDNLSKAVLDAMKKVVYRDDRTVEEIHLRKFVNKIEPGITVTVSEIEGSNG